MENVVVQVDLEFNWKDDPAPDHEIWGLSLPSFTLVEPA